MRRTNKVYLVTWSYPGGAWNVVRAYVDTKAQARKAAKVQFGSGIEIHDIFVRIKLQSDLSRYSPRILHRLPVLRFWISGKP